MNLAKRLARWSLIALLLTLPAAAAEEQAGLPGLDGGRLRVADLEQGDHVIVVWASWSPRSRDIGARVGAIAKRWGGRARVLTINFQEEPERARDFARRQKIEVPVYLDRDASFAKRHAVTSLPFLLIVSQGKTAFAGKLPPDVDAVIGRYLDK